MIKKLYFLSILSLIFGIFSNFPLLEAMEFETLAMAGIEPAISTNDESYNKLPGKQRQLWLDLLFEISTEQSIIGASRHLLHIGKKK